MIESGPSRRAAVWRLLPWLGVLLVAAAVRAPSLTAARPYLSYVDEGHFLHASARMIRDRSWIPEAFNYPSLPIAAVAIAARALDPSIPAAVRNRSGRYYDVLEPFELVLVGRVLSFLAGLGVVIFTGLLAQRVAGPRAGLLAAFSAALLPALVIRGGIATVDPFAALFAVACLYCTERTRASGRPLDALAAGAMAGLAFTSKYPAILVAFSFALTIGLARRERLRLWACAAAGAVGAALLAMPALVLVPHRVLAGVQRQAALYANRTSIPLWRQAFERAEWDFPYDRPELGWIFVALAAAGLAAALRDRQIRQSALGWTLFAAASLVLYTGQGYQPFRNLLPLLPIACVAVAILVQKLPRRPWVDAAAFLLIAVLFAPAVVGFARERWRLDDSRTQTIDWLSRQSLPSEPGQLVLVLDHLAFLPSELERLPGRAVEVHPWETLRRRLGHRRAQYLVIARMDTLDGRPLLGPADLEAIAERYRLRAEFGEEAPTAYPGRWHGNRQAIQVFERKPVAGE